MSTYVFSIVTGVFFILLGCLSVFGLCFNIKGINNIYYTGWMKNKTKRKQLSFSFIVSFILILIGFFIIKYKIFFSIPLH